MTALKPSSSSSSLTPSEVSRRIKLLLKEEKNLKNDASRLDELRRIFTKLERSGDLEFGKPLPENQTARKWRSFLLKNHKLMVSQLCHRVTMGRHTAVRCFWGVMAGSPIISQNGMYKHVNTELLQQWFKAMTFQESEDHMDRAMKHMVESEFLRQYRDVQYYALGCITRLADEQYENRNEASSTLVAARLMELLLMIPVPTGLGWDAEEDDYLCPPPNDAVPDDDEDENDDDNNGSEDDETDDSANDDDTSSEDERLTNSRPKKRQKKASTVGKFSFQKLKVFRREYQKAWLAVLKLPLPMSHLKRALNFLPNDVLMNVPVALRFSDFFIQAYSDHSTGVIGVLALDGLFMLIMEHALEYPDFYKQLYRLVSARVLHAKYRVRFFTLLTKCLTLNEMLPAHLVAAFAKRLCRSALSGPPSGALFVLALVSNLLRKHRECSPLIHRKASDDIEDPFLPNENDPVESRALQSSLWELSAMERHYHPAVVTLAKSIGTLEELNAPMHDIDAFVSHTYKDLFDQERKKKTKKTALTFKEPSGLFVKGDTFAGILNV